MILLFWIGLALVLAFAELAAGDFGLLMLAGGAAAAAGVNAMGAPIWLQFITFLIVSGLLIGLVRPILHRRLRITRTQLDSSSRELEGSEATVIEEVTPTGGMIRVAGDLWSARSTFEHEDFAPDTKVIITRIDSAHAYVSAAIERTQHD